jgi:hypothetical protein
VSLESAINRLADAGFAIAEAIGGSSKPLPQPGPFSIRLVSERRVNDMSDFLTYEATLPTVPAGTDVTSQRFSVVEDGVAQAEQTLAKDATTATFEVTQGASVDLSLTYVDDAGNVSAPRTQSFVAQDSLPPDAPGDFQEIKVVSERTVPDA